jgi:transketolase
MNLEQVARDTRALTIRSIAAARSGHPGSCMSAVEAMVLLHCEVMRGTEGQYHPDKAQDIFVLSAGHKAPLLYSLWSVLGWIPEADTLSLRKLSSPYQGHPSRQHTPWCWTSTGSLGQGLAVAVGYALAYRRQGLDKKVYCLASEGDLNEGISTEALRLAVHFKLNNFTLLVDYNKKMSDRHSQLMVHPVAELEGLGLLVEECLGNNFHSIRSLLSLAGKVHTRPMAIILHTIKGYPISYMINDPDAYHGSVCLSQDEVDRALLELETEVING